MKLFKSKAEKLQERKMQVKQSMKELEKRIRKLQEQEKVYIEAARVAQKEDLPDQVKLARDALKMTISERKRTMSMLLNTKILSQMQEMSEMTGEFLKSIQNISKNISGVASADMSKIQGELKVAMNMVADQTDNLSDMLEDSQDDVSSFSSNNALVTDDDIDGLIYGNGQDTTDDDAALAEMRAQLDK